MATIESLFLQLIVSLLLVLFNYQSKRSLIETNRFMVTFSNQNSSIRAKIKFKQLLINLI